MIQGMATRYITGGIKGTAYNTLEAHTNIPLIDLFHKAQFHVATIICTLPSHHPLQPLTQKTAACLVKSQVTTALPLLHYRYQTPASQNHLYLQPMQPTYCPTMQTTIDKNKEALKFSSTVHNLTCYKIYCDGSGYKDGAGSAAVLYKGARAVKTLLLHISPTTEHTVYDTELIGLLLALLHLLASLTCLLLVSTIIIGLDNQVAIKALNNQRAKPAHYLLDHIHSTAEHLQSNQDHLHCKDLFQQAKHNNKPLQAKTRGVVNLHIHWVLSHNNSEPNEKADKAAKCTMLGESSSPQNLLSQLCDKSPTLKPREFGPVTGRTPMLPAHTLNR